MIKRFWSKKNRFWKNIRIFGGALATVGLIISTAPISLPSALVGWGAYLASVGSSITILAQLTKE